MPLEAWDGVTAFTISWRFPFFGETILQEFGEKNSFKPLLPGRNAGVICI